MRQQQLTEAQIFTLFDPLTDLLECDTLLSLGRPLLISAWRLDRYSEGRHEPRGNPRPLSSPARDQHEPSQRCAEVPCRPSAPGARETPRACGGTNAGGGKRGGDDPCL